MSAQENYQKTYEVPVERDEVEEAKFNSDIEALLRRDIESYLGSNRFIIQVDALIECTRTVVKKMLSLLSSANKLTCLQPKGEW